MERKNLKAEFKFKECSSCSEKSGAPALCVSCFENRKAIDVLQSELGKTIKLLKMWSDVINKVDIGMDILTLLPQTDKIVHDWRDLWQK